MVQTQRNSSFELLRLIAQYFIVVYHILLFWFVLEGRNDNPMFFKAFWIPLHIGVILFVLISGYFGIRTSIKGLFRIVFPMLIYGLGFYVLNQFLHGESLQLKKLFFVSNTGYWFMRTYLYLYLVAPMINRIIPALTSKTRFLFLGILAWMSCFVGLFFDQSFHEGYNLVHFVFLYLIGNTLYVYRDNINKVPLIGIIIAYLLVNVMSIGTWLSFIGKSFEDECWHLAFEYNSLVLIANAVLFFIPFMRISIHSKVINSLASSCLAIYLIHSGSLMFRGPIRDVAYWVQEYANNRGGGKFY